MSDKTPIVFIHYGDTPYLRYTLDIAKKLNPEKKVFLLGDKKNKKYKKYNVRHNYFSKYNKNESIKKLNKNFIYIGGTNRQTDQDKRFELFCFKRWFYLYEFMKKNRLNKCWYFDSDTLILSDLSKEEEKFENYDITEQSNGSNMKGLIKIDFLENFINTINKIFLDKNYLENQKKDIKNNPNYAFCDMRAYSKFKEASKPKSIMLKTILNNKNYDENICQKDGMETEFTEELKREVKKLYFKNGKIFELFKFRTMIKDAEKNKAQWASENDNRITKIGKILRKTRLDELPQIWNVLKGDLSFIGPRPERPEFVEMLKKEIPHYAMRHLVKPGLSGWAQIKYPYAASVKDAEEKLQYDLYYIKNRSMVLDLAITAKTIATIVSRQGR